MTAEATNVTHRLPSLASVVDALVAQPLDDLSAVVLQEQIVAVAPQAARREGWVQAAAGRLDALTGGQLPTDDGGSRAVAGWLADCTSPGTPTAAHPCPTGSTGYGIRSGSRDRGRRLRALPASPAPRRALSCTTTWVGSGR